MKRQDMLLNIASTIDGINDSPVGTPDYLTFSDTELHSVRL
jgi:hypothetical protein